MKINGKIIIIILAAVLFIVLLTTAFLFAMSLGNDESEEEAKLGPIHETQEFTVNVSNTLNHFIKAKFSVEMTNKEALEELESKIVIVDDIINMVLAGADLQVLSSVEGKEELKETLQLEINKVLKKGQVKQIYYKSIIFQ